MLTEAQKKAILNAASEEKPKGEKATRPKHWRAEKRAARKRSTASKAKNKPKKLSRRKKGKKLHLRKRRNR